MSLTTLTSLYEQVFYSLSSDDPENIYLAIKTIEKDCYYEKIHLYLQTNKNFSGRLVELAHHPDERISKIASEISPCMIFH